MSYNGVRQKRKNKGRMRFFFLALSGSWDERRYRAEVAGETRLSRPSFLGVKVLGYAQLDTLKAKPEEERLLTLIFWDSERDLSLRLAMKDPQMEIK